MVKWFSYSKITPIFNYVTSFLDFFGWQNGPHPHRLNVVPFEPRCAWCGLAERTFSCCPAYSWERLWLCVHWSVWVCVYSWPSDCAWCGCAFGFPGVLTYNGRSGQRCEAFFVFAAAGSSLVNIVLHIACRPLLGFFYAHNITQVAQRWLYRRESESKWN